MGSGSIIDPNALERDWFAYWSTTATQLGAAASSPPTSISFASSLKVWSSSFVSPTDAEMTTSSLGGVLHPAGIDGLHHQRQRSLQRAISDLFGNAYESVESHANHQVVHRPARELVSAVLTFQVRGQSVSDHAHPHILLVVKVAQFVGCVTIDLVVGLIFDGIDDVQEKPVVVIGVRRVQPRRFVCPNEVTLLDPISYQQDERRQSVIEFAGQVASVRWLREVEER